MSAGELWYVRLSNGDVHHVTVDQLDVAFEAGHIDVDTLVLEDGSNQWKRLGEAAGLDDDGAEEQPPQQQHVGSAAPRSFAPAPVMSPTPGPVVRTVSAMPPAAQAPVYAQPAVSRAPAYVQQAPVSRAPAYAQAPASRAPASYAAPAGSLRPVAFDLSDDLDLGVSYKKRGSSKGWAVAVMSLALVGGGVGFAATHGVGLAAVGGGSSDFAAAAAAPIAPPPVDPIPTPAAAPAPAPVPAPPAALAGSLPSMDSSLNPRFTDAQKDKLLAADKARSDRAGARQSTYQAPHHYKTSTAFTKGGNKYDPLNSDL